jgi:hypothetical protein
MDLYQCLECYKDFLWGYYCDFSFCPHCGTRFTAGLIYKEKKYIPSTYPKDYWIITYDVCRQSRYSEKYTAVNIIDIARSFSNSYGPVKISRGKFSMEIDELEKDRARWHPVAFAMGFTKKEVTSGNQNYFERGEDRWNYWPDYDSFREYIEYSENQVDIEIHNRMLPENPVIPLI